MSAPRDCALMPSILDSLQSKASLNTTDCCSSSRYIICEGGQITWLMLNGTQSTGTIPGAISQLKGLQVLWLYRNQLTGSIPPSLGDLSQLQTLELGRNLLTGTVPATLGNLTSLQTLYLYENALTGPLPLELGNLRRLQYILLEGNPDLKGPMPAQWQDLQMAYGDCGGYGVAKGPGPTDYYCCNMGNLCRPLPNVTLPKNCGNADVCILPAPQTSTTLSDGAIAGISVGALVLVALGAFAVYLFVRLKKVKSEPPPTPTIPGIVQINKQSLDGNSMIQNNPSSITLAPMHRLQSTFSESTRQQPSSTYFNPSVRASTAASLNQEEPLLYLPGNGVILDHPYAQYVPQVPMQGQSDKFS